MQSWPSESDSEEAADQRYVDLLLIQDSGLLARAVGRARKEQTRRPPSNDCLFIITGRKRHQLVDV